MGCSASKETAVATPTPSNNAGGKQQPSSSSTTASNNNGSAASAPGSTAQEQPTGSRMIHLNDVEPLPNSDAANQEHQRGRFLSYASGASTPNTSSNDLASLDGSNLSDGSGGAAAAAAPKKSNPKSLKKSGSAIGLDDIHTESTGLTSKVVHIEVPFGKPIEEVYEGVHSGPVLGSGVSGLVRLVKHKATGLEYAVKCLDLGLVGTKEGLAQLREEIFIMCQLDHPNIVRLEEVYESHSEIYLVQELCVGGELFDRLDEQPDYHYTESECARLVKQMLSAVRYLHSKGIIHRDLKLENFLFSSKAADSELKMIDFGLSKHFRYGEVHHEAVGTPYTVAPEVIAGSYDERCDIWAIGVIAFLLLSGDPPFGGCGGPEPLLTVRANILSGKYAFEPEDIWDLVSENGKNFVRAMLVKDPKKRPTAREAQKHPWLKEWASRQSAKTDNVLNPNVVKALVNFKEYSHFRKLLSEVLSFTLLPEQIVDLRKEFEKMDTDGSGEISLKALKEVLLTNAGAGSLGALNEDEVEDIFNAMRVNKTETRIHWHEFIAAGLSQCRVDDRNLRLAFDRLDSDHKGFITLDDIMNLVGSDELHSMDQMRAMWEDSMKSVNCTQAHISYEQFLLLMKGQTKEASPCEMLPQTTRMGTAQTPLLVVPEGKQVECDESVEIKVNNPMKKETIISAIPEEGSAFLEKKDGDDVSIHSLPNLGGGGGMHGSSGSDMGLGSPGTSPAVQKKVTDIEANESTSMPSPTGGRGRSKSLANEYDNPDDESNDFKVPRRNDTTTSQNNDALAVKRTLYHAHRQMRLSVLDASRRFEEEQTRRARDTLIAQKEAADARSGVPKAGLVMRHGQRVQVTSEAIRQYLEKYYAEQQELVEKANKRGGRGRASRKKTISDMSAMLNPSMGQDEMGAVIAQATMTPDIKKQLLNNQSLSKIDVPDLRDPPKFGKSTNIPGPSSKDAPITTPSLSVIDKTLRKATVPGEFRKTNDPFSANGMYGGSRISHVDVHQIKAKKDGLNKTKK